MHLERSFEHILDVMTHRKSLLALRALARSLEPEACNWARESNSGFVGLRARRHRAWRLRHRSTQTTDGCEIFSERGRGWNRDGAPRPRLSFGRVERSAEPLFLLIPSTHSIALDAVGAFPDSGGRE
jgi:hypothetical protein